MPTRIRKCLIIMALTASTIPVAVHTAAASARHHGHGAHVSYRTHHAGYGGVIQCVAFAKAASDVALSGNARDWWYNADGVYQRGARPEVGAVLTFKENGRMPLGHVAVVSGLADSRTIVIDQSHWNSRGITRDIQVKDVSENNDWTAVRVQLGAGDTYGSIYPTHGFIYARPDAGPGAGQMVANTTHAPLPDMDQPPADLRTARTSRRHRRAIVEVAEAPALPAPHAVLDLSVGAIAIDAPDRGLR